MRRTFCFLWREGRGKGEEEMYEPGFYPRGARECGAVAPEDGVAGDEVGCDAGEEEEAAEDAEDVEEGEVRWAVVCVCVGCGV